MTRSVIGWAGLATAALCSFGALGCAGVRKLAKPEVPLWVNHPGSAMSVFARRQLTVRDSRGGEPYERSSKRDGEPYERARPALDPAHRRVFVGTSDGGLYALHAVDLSTLWRFQTAGGVHSEPWYDPHDDAVYFGSNDGALYKLRAADGKMLWRFSSAAEITERPLWHSASAKGGTLFVVNANDTLLAIDPQSGELRWYRQRTPAFGMEISGYAGPAVYDDMVYTAFSDGVVMAYRVDDGREAWSTPVDLTAGIEQTKLGTETRYLDVDTTPVVTEVNGAPLLFVASYEGGVHALDARSGAEVWNNDAATGVTELTLYEAPVKPRRADGKSRWSKGRHRVLVAASGLTGLWAFKLDDGAELWHRDLPAGGVTAAEPWAGALLVGTTRYGLFLFHPLDGGVLDGVHSGGAFAGAPAAYGRRAYILGNEGTLFGLYIQPPG